MSGMQSLGEYMGKYIIDSFYYFIFDFNNSGELAIFSPDSFFHHGFTDNIDRQNYLDNYNYYSCLYSLQDNEIDRYNFVDLSWHKYLKNITELRKCIRYIASKTKNIHTIYLLGTSVGASNIYFFLIELLDIICSEDNFLKDLKTINVKLISNTGVCYNAYTELVDKIKLLLTNRKQILISLNSIVGLNDKTILPGIILVPSKENLSNLEQNLVVVDPNNCCVKDFHTLPLYANILFKYIVYSGPDNMMKYLQYLSKNIVNETNYLDRKNCKKNFIEQNNIFSKQLSTNVLEDCAKNQLLLQNINILYTNYIQEYCKNKILNQEINFVEENLQKLLDYGFISNNTYNLIKKQNSKSSFKYLLNYLFNQENKILLFYIVKFIVYDWIFYLKKELLEMFYYLLMIFSVFYHLLDNIIYKYLNKNLENIKSLLKREKVFDKTIAMLRQNS